MHPCFPYGLWSFDVAVVVNVVVVVVGGGGGGVGGGVFLTACFH